MASAGRSRSPRRAGAEPKEAREPRPTSALNNYKEDKSGGAQVARPAFRGAILLRGNVIEEVLPWEKEEEEHEEVLRLVGLFSASGQAVSVVNCGGRAVIPGLVEGHAHPSFEDVVGHSDTGDMPPEEGVLTDLLNCGRLLEAGFTSAFSAAASRPRLDVVARNWINAGRSRGPRLLAASPEICATGCLGDASALHQHRDGFGLVADGPEEVRRAVRLCAREGVDIIKINIGGDLVPTNMLTEAKDDVLTTYTAAEVAAACEEAHARQKRVAAHCRGSGDVKLALEYGVDVIYHCDFAYKDEQILNALEDAKDRVFLGPAVGLMDALSPGGIFAPMGAKGIPDIGVLLQAQRQTYQELRRRGLRVVIGGDYGFRVTPQGLNANDLVLFQRHFGYSAEEALVCATRIGGQLMRLKVGQLRSGWLADLLVVDGEPWKDSSPLLASIGENDGEVLTPGIKAIVQDGFFHRSQL